MVRRATLFLEVTWVLTCGVSSRVALRNLFRTITPRLAASVTRQPRRERCWLTGGFFDPGASGNRRSRTAAGSAGAKSFRARMVEDVRPETELGAYVSRSNHN